MPEIKARNHWNINIGPEILYINVCEDIKILEVTGNHKNDQKLPKKARKSIKRQDMTAKH